MGVGLELKWIWLFVPSCPGVNAWNMVQFVGRGSFAVRQIDLPDLTYAHVTI